MKARIQAVIAAKDKAAALKLLKEIHEEWDLSPAGLEPIKEAFGGTYVTSKFFGNCEDCGSPYVEGERIWWRGPGLGAECEGCHVAEVTGPSCR
jgi:hypothetical protein